MSHSGKKRKNSIGDGEDGSRTGESFREIRKTDHFSSGEMDRLLSVLSITVDSTADGILTLDLEGNVLLYNRTFARMWGIPMEILEKSDNRLLLDWVRGKTKDPETFTAGVRELMKHPECESVQQVELSDGRVFERFYRPQYEEGRLVSRVLCFRDVTRHVQAEHTLSEERNLLRTLIDNLPDHIYIKNPDSRFITCNTATARFMGAGTPENLVGKSDFDYYPQEVADVFFQEEQRIIRTEQPVIGHEVNRTDAEGRSCWISTNKVPLRNSEGEVTGIVGIGHDVTARRETEEALRESEERYRRLSELTQEGIALFENGMLRDTNTSFRRLFGIDPEEALDNDLLKKLIRPEYRDQVQRHHTDGIEEPYQVMAQTKEGRVFPVEIESREIALEGRRIQVISVRDVTERKKAEDTLAFERYLLAALMDSMPDNIYFKDRESRFIRINRALAHKFGLSDPLEAVGMTDFDFFTQEHADPAFRDEQEVIQTGKPVINKEEKETFPDGREYYMTTTRMPLRDKAGRIIGTFGISRDITDRVKAEQQLHEREEQLRQAQKIEAVGRLAGGIAHDFNNILTAIIGYADISLMREDLPPGLEQQIRQIKIAAGRAATLTDQLLAFSRKQPRKPTSLDLNRVVDELHPMLERLIGENIQLHTSMQEEQVLIYTDPGQMEQVIMNLVLNARDAMPEGGVLTVSTSLYAAGEQDHDGSQEPPPGSYAQLTVSDTGGGLDPEAREHMFEPFYTTKEIGKGTGLGLSTVYGIVKQNGGHIKVYSEPGKGTTFSVYLPVAHQEEHREEKKKL